MFFFTSSCVIVPFYGLLNLRSTYYIELDIKSELNLIPDTKDDLQPDIRSLPKQADKDIARFCPAT